MVLDGGDFIPGEEDTLRVEKADLMLRAMETMRYDAVGIGELELINGLRFLARAAERLPLVCANLKLPPALAAKIPAVRWLDRHGLRIAVTGYVDPLLYYTWPGAFQRSADSLTVTDPVLAVGEVVREVRKDADLVMVLAHGSDEQVRAWLQEVPGVDVVVPGHEPRRARQVVRVGDTYLIEAGPRSRCVGDLRLEMKDDGTIAGFGYRLWDLKKQRGIADLRLDAVVKEFQARYGLKR